MLKLDITLNKTQEGPHRKAPRKRKTKHDSKIKCREQHGQDDGDARPSQCDPKHSGATVA